MNILPLIQKQVNDLYYGGNYTGVNFSAVLKDITFEQAITKVQDFNTIHTLVFHTQYYMDALNNVLDGNPLDASDALSFVHPPIHSQKEWETVLHNMFASVDIFIAHLTKLDPNNISKTFKKEAYGTYYRNIVGVIEHSHYHLGQIVFLKKMVS